MSKSKNLGELLDEVIKTLSENLKEMKEDLKENLKEECFIHIDKDETGKVALEMRGNRFNLLTTLAGAKIQLLKDLDGSTEEWEFIENKVSTKEVTNSEK